jgi:hypothetical protein
MLLREIGERVGLHLSAVGNSVQRVAKKAEPRDGTIGQRADDKFKNQES